MLELKNNAGIEFTIYQPNKAFNYTQKWINDTKRLQVLGVSTRLLISGEYRIADVRFTSVFR